MSATTTSRHYAPPALFALGQTLMTCGVADLVALNKLNPIELLRRHASGDWGDLCAEDKVTNQIALRHGDRLMSSYKLAPDLTVWIITEWDRSVTTLLLPSEY